MAKPNSITKLSTGIFTDNKLTSVTIPSSITEIGYNALGYNNLTSIDIPNSITKIGALSFYYNKLTSVTIPNSVIEIESSAFRLNKLTSVTLPNSLKEISQYSFSDNKLTSIVIPNTVTTIHRGSFTRNKLVNVTIPNSVTLIGDAAFAGNEITSVEIPSSVTKIYEQAFNDNKISLINGKTSDGIIFARKTDGTDDTSKIVSYGGAAKIIDFIPTSVKVIGEYAFYSNGLSIDLTRVDLPNSITTIGRSAFSYNKLTSIVIPKSVTVLDYGAFVNNDITSFILPEAEKPGYLFKNWNGNIEANTEVSNLWNKYTANFEKLQQSQTITFDVLNDATYGDNDIALTATTSSNLPVTYTSSNSLVAEIVNGKIHIVNAGTCNILANQDGNSDYLAADEVSVAFTVIPKAIAVVANANQTKVYGELDPTLTYTADALVGSDTFSGKLSRDLGENVGFYGIRIRNLSAGNNYSITFHSENFEISEVLSENIVETSNFSIFPNPTKSNLFITNDARNKLSIKIIDLNGRVIIERISSNDKIELNLEGYSSGIYNIVIEFEGNSITNKIIKK